MSDQKLALRTIRNSLLNIFSFLFALGVNFFLLRYVVETIGKEYFGLSGLMMALVAPLSLANLGFGEATTKYVAEHAAKQRWEVAGKYIQTTLIMNLMVGLFGGLILFFLGGWIANEIWHETIGATNRDLVNQCMRVIGFGWLINQLSATFIGIPVAMQRFRIFALGNIGINLVLAALTFMLLQAGWGLLGYTIATVSSSFFGLIFWRWMCIKMLPGVSLLPKFHRGVWKSSFHYGGWQTISQIGGIAAQNGEKYLMGIFLNLASNGIYNVAFNIEQKIYTIVYKLSEVLFPTFAAMEPGTGRTTNIVLKSSWILTVVSCALLLSIIPLSHSLIFLWMRDISIADAGTPVLQTLCMAGALGSASNAGYFYFLGSGQTRKLTFISLLTGLVTLTISALALPDFGLPAAGLSALGAAAVQSLLIARLLYRDTGTSFTRLFVSLYLPIIPALIFWPLAQYFDFGWYSWIGFGLNFGMLLLFFVVITISFHLIFAEGRVMLSFVKDLILPIWKKITPYFLK